MKVYDFKWFQFYWNVPLRKFEQIDGETVVYGIAFKSNKMLGLVVYREK